MTKNTTPRPVGTGPGYHAGAYRLKLTPEQLAAKTFYVTPYFVGREKVYMTFDEMARNVGPGWKTILEELVVKLLHLGWDGGYMQIKEKFGTLRFYWANNIANEINSHIADDCVVEAEFQSGQYCETCGRYAKCRNDGWVLTLCALCAVDEGRAIHNYEYEYLLEKGLIDKDTKVTLVEDDD